MLADFIASDNRYFFEQELAQMLQTRMFSAKMGQACLRSFGSGERAVVQFKGDHEQEHLLQVLNADVRYLRLQGIEYGQIARLLRVASKSPLYDEYELRLEQARLTFTIRQYHLRSGDKVLIVDPLRDPRAETSWLMRVVELVVYPIVLTQKQAPEDDR